MKSAIVLFVCLLGGCVMTQAKPQEQSAQKPQEQSQEKPPLPFYDWGVCPFECCTYRQWTLLRPVSFHQTHDKDSPVMFRLEQGQTVTGVTGVAITTKYGTAKVLKSVETLGFTKDPERLPFSGEPGQTLYVLNYEGEWDTLFWYKGKLYSGGIPVDDCEKMPASCEYVRPESQAEETWWVMVQTPGGEIGWSDETDAFEHMDACGD
ncbi:MAG TPA: hypothetical protein VGK20_08630 [Candidatus Binatia bacterium]|jgi:hypothetical protein